MVCPLKILVKICAVFNCDGCHATFSLIRNLVIAGHDAICDNLLIHQRSPQNYSHTPAAADLFQLASCEVELADRPLGWQPTIMTGGS
jgi:hypothetical protein